MIGNIILTICSLLLTPLTSNFTKILKKTPVFKEISSLYPNNKFMHIRFWDAPYLEVEAFIPKKGNIVDLGCGEGLFSNFIALSSAKRKVYGVEINKLRIQDAYKGLGNTVFISGDITKKNIPIADTIILFHVLHHLASFKQQENLLQKCYKKIKKDGKLIIVEVEPKFSYKYFLAWFVDHFLVSWIFEKKLYSPIYFRSSKDWIGMINKLGFKARQYDLDSGKPFSHVLIEAVKI